MAKGWDISLNDGNRHRIFKVGITNADEAQKMVVAQCSKPSGVVALPLKDGEFEKLGLVEGQIIESTESN